MPPCDHSLGLTRAKESAIEFCGECSGTGGCYGKNNLIARGQDWLECVSAFRFLPTRDSYLNPCPIVLATLNRPRNFCNSTLPRDYGNVSADTTPRDANARQSDQIMAMLLNFAKLSRCQRKTVET